MTGHNTAHSDAGEPEKLKMPEDTSAGDAAQEDSDASNKSGSKSGSRAASSVDTIIGRLVVEQGLATRDEVQAVADRAKGDPKGGSLAERLIQSDYITTSQLHRLRATVEAERSGQQIPGYRILGKLGAGAMATVFKAKQLSLDRLVAIKVLPRKFSSNAEFIQRFYTEGRIAAQLNHPSIVQAYDVGQAGEFHYFVMEYVEGSTVFDQIVRHKRYPEEEAIELAIQIAEALEHAHSKGLIHRDVKPKNIMITKEGVAKLADMGLARAISDKEAAEAEAGKAYGTPYYIAPEQIRGARELTPAADIYSFGATLYHMLTGVVPYDGKSPADVMRKHLKAELVPPDHVNPKLSAGISQVIEMMMAKDPKARYQSCKDLLTDLRAIKSGEPPIMARKEDHAAVLANLAQEAESQPESEIPVDQSSRGNSSPWTHPAVQFIVGFLILSIVANIVLALFSIG